MTRSLLLMGAFACTSAPDSTDTSTFDTGTSVTSSTSEGCTLRRWWADTDHDGAGDPESPAEACSAPADFVDNGSDCDDQNADAFPGNPERCDGRDQDCTGIADDGLEDVDFWPDVDGDGHGDGRVAPVTGCALGGGQATNGDDCDDADADRFPDNPERCDGLDQDCNAEPDNGLVFVDYRLDADQDGVGTDDQVVWTCDGPPVGTVLGGGDCDDADPGRFPGNPEVCDGIDQDCTDLADDGLPIEDFWVDADQDGVGDTDQRVTTCDGQPPGTVTRGGDCDDTDPDQFPGNPERCDGLDQDCDGDLDDGLLFSDWFPDDDLDGYGDDTEAIATCDGQPPGTIMADGDCNDADPLVHPGADTSACDRVDTDCDGVVEEQRVPEDHPSLQDAIDAAADGGMICVAAGTWTTHAVVDNKELVIRGDRSPVLDGTTGAVLELISAGATEVSGFVVTGATGVDGVGLRIVDSTPVLRDLEVTANTCGDHGLAGHCLGVGISLERSSAILENVRIADNTADATEYVYGVGLYALDSDLTLVDVAVSGNVAEADYISGVAIALDSGSNLVADGLSILDNLGTGGNNAMGVALDSCLFSSGGNSTVDLTDTIIENNDSDGPSGNIVNLCDDPSDLLVRVTFRGNNAENLVRTTDATIHNLLLVDNVSYGALFSVDGTLTLEQATFADNTIYGSTQYIAPLFGGNGGDLTLRNSVITDTRFHVGVEHPPFPAMETFDVPVNAHYDDVYASGDAAPLVVGTQGNLAVPAELDADYRPLPGSPLVDAGHPTVFDPDGSRADIGVYGGPYAFP